MSDLGKAEILHSIKEAEQKVREMTKEGEEKRKQLQAEGKKAALEKTYKAEIELKGKIEGQTAAARSDIEMRKKAILEEGSRKAESMAAAARKNIGKAKELVLSEFERAVDA